MLDAQRKLYRSMLELGWVGGVACEHCGSVHFALLGLQGGGKIVMCGACFETYEWEEVGKAIEEGATRQQSGGLFLSKED